MSVIDLVVMIGQSLSCGSYSSPFLTTNSFGNGVRLQGSVFSTIPKLEEAIEGSPQAGWPPQETPLSAALEYANNGRLESDKLLLGIHSGVPGAGYSSLKKGSGNWNNVFLAQLDAVKKLGYKINPIAISLIHGESDSMTTDYKDNLIQWQKDFSEAIHKAFDLDPRQIPFVMCQPSNYMGFRTFVPSYPDHPVSGAWMLELAREQPERFKLVGPKYHLTHSADRVHLTNLSSQTLGLYHGRAIKALRKGEGWSGFLPHQVVKLSERKHRIYFDVPVLPLRFDTTAIATVANKGFDYVDSTASAVVISVEISGANSIDITLSSNPTGANRFIRYAWTTNGVLESGPINGPRGQLMDSDISAPYNLPAGSMPNYCPHFQIAI
jgi:hypothetical protein